MAFINNRFIKRRTFLDYLIPRSYLYFSPKLAYL